MRIPCDAVAATAALGSLVPRGLQNGPTLHMDDRELAMYFLQLTRTLIGDFCAQRGCVCVFDLSYCVARCMYDMDRFLHMEDHINIGT